MKPLLSCGMLLIIGFGFASSHLYAQYSSLAKEEVKKNKIESISEDSHFPCDFDFKNSDQWKVYTWSRSRTGYDPRGNVTSEYQDSKWNAAPVSKGYKYDDKDNLIETTLEYITRPVEHKFTLDDKGKVVEDDYWGDRHTLKYNSAGNVVESAEFKSDGKLAAKKTYDGKGDVTEAVGYDSSRKVYIYDDARHRTKQEEYDSAGRLSSRIVFTYDAAGHNAREEKYDSNGHLSSAIVYTYDEGSHYNKSEEYTGSDGKTLKGWSTYKYDPKGLLIERSDFGPKAECQLITKFSYAFFP